MSLSSQDELEILRLHSQYAQYTSQKDAVRWSTLFTDDAVWERKEPAKGTKYNEKVRVQGTDALKKFANENYAEQGNSQYFSANAIVTGDGTTAEGSVSILIIRVENGQPSIVVVGNFEDKYVKTASGWKFKYRGVSLLG
ncbi:nuclear transport factor 2 family protein [Paraburkholderia sp. LEh10]|uniref:nuclear transport factor 2 family protein n=1 Tax=Paraburkholderia sp. LEh10 TaxID=2821353 RepID=UPI001AE222DA|nr:nuclear transport factor 2 family protein [Paraburkholderia sp. LEh10]MBP0590458.1 nuclear transport factor 2 family protein [Paraburkholderia sp. LEh10]